MTPPSARRISSILPRAQELCLQDFAELFCSSSESGIRRELQSHLEAATTKRMVEFRVRSGLLAQLIRGPQIGL